MQNDILPSPPENSRAKYVTSKKLYLLCFIILSISGIVNFLSCCFPLLTRKPIFQCEFSPNVFSQCTANDVCNATSLSYYKDKALSTDNFAYEFDFYCSRYYYVGILGTAYYFGSFLGSLILGNVIDIYGRQHPFKLLILTNLILMINLYFVYNPLHLVIIFFITGVCSYTKSLCSIIITEYMQSSITAVVISISNSMFPILGFSVGIYYIFVNSWKSIVFILVIITTTTTTLSYIYVDESPRWLMLYKNKESNNELEQSLINKVEVRSFSYIEIINLKSQQKNLLIVSFLTFTSSMSYYGLILNIDNYVGDFFSNYLMTYTAEAMAIILSGYIADYFGRINTMKFFTLLAAITFALFEIVGGFLKIERFSYIFVFLISFGNAAFFNVLNISTMEYFPTVIRGSCVGLTNIVGKAATTIVPSMTTFVSHSPFLFSFFLILSVLVINYLEETKGKEIQDLVPELEKNREE